MVSDGRNLVWSIEGGRTRTGKLRPPRYGLLKYVTDAVESVHSEQTLAIPVSILFDQLPLHEVKLMVEESRGLPKRPENVRWLFSYARGLRHRLGRIYINFGAPVPLHERMVALRAEGLTDRQVVERVALDICHRLNQATPVSATAAVSVAMLGADRALTLDEVCATVAPLARYLVARGWPVAGGADLTDRATVSQTLHDLVGSGVLTSYLRGAGNGVGDRRRPASDRLGVPQQRYPCPGVQGDRRTGLTRNRADTGSNQAHGVGEGVGGARNAEIRILLRRPRRIRRRVVA